MPWRSLSVKFIQAISISASIKFPVVKLCQYEWKRELRQNRDRSGMLSAPPTPPFLSVHIVPLILGFLIHHSIWLHVPSNYWTKSRDMRTGDLQIPWWCVLECQYFFIYLPTCLVFWGWGTEGVTRFNTLITPCLCYGCLAAFFRFGCLGQCLY